MRKRKFEIERLCSENSADKRRRGRRVLPGALVLILFSLMGTAFAVPETTSVRVTDVTPSSFALVWMTDVAAVPAVEVYADSAMQQRLTDGLTITSQPAGSARVAEAARAKGIMKVRISGANPSTTYYVRTVTADPANAASIGYSALQPVTTASNVDLYQIVEGEQQELANDLAAMRVYVRPMDAAAEPGLGDLMLLEDPAAAYPASAFVGDGVPSPEGVLDLNNLFDMDGTSLISAGGGRITMRIYRAGNLSSLTHYRRIPQNSGQVSIAGLVAGFFADINLDGAVDAGDFAEFKAHYKTAPDDTIYNPDYNFVDDAEGKVDVREFSKFALEYGRTNVQ